MSSQYFPSLDKCLTGNCGLISWKAAYRALGNLDSALENASLESFLADSETISILQHSLQPFARPSEKSKNDFETKTAPIHVGQSINGEIHLQQLKEDASWLSKELDLEELVGLRVALLEWQQRAPNGLLDSAFDMPDGRNAPFDTSSLDQGAAEFDTSTNAASQPLNDYANGDLRHARQLQIYLEERSYIRRLSVALVEMTVRTTLLETSSHETWLDKLASQLTHAHEAGSSQSREYFLLCMSSIENDIRSIDDPQSRPSQFRPIDIVPNSFARHEGFVNATTLDIVSTLRMLAAYIALQNTMLTASTVLEWFKLADRMLFFEELRSSTVAQERFIPIIQCLAAVITLSILNLPQAIGHIQNAASPSQSSNVNYPRLLSSAEPYIEDTSCVRDITVILYRAACSTSATAAPAIYAWSIITGFLRDIVQVQHDSKDRQIEDVGASSDHDSPQGRRASSLRGSSEPKSIFERLFESVQDFNLEQEHREDPPRFLAQMAVDVLEVYSIVAKLSGAMSAAFCAEVEVMTPFIARYACLGLVREGMLCVNYDAEVLGALLAIIAPQPPEKPVFDLESFLASRFLKDDLFRRQILDQALSRYPFELAPALRLVTALVRVYRREPETVAHFIDVLDNLSTMMLPMTDNFKGYELWREDEGLSEMKLTDYVFTFVPKSPSKNLQTLQANQMLLGDGQGFHGSNITTIPPETLGVMMSEEPPWVVRFQHPHSGLGFLGLLFSTFAETSEFIVAPPGSCCDYAMAADILDLITTLLESSRGAPELSSQLLANINSALPQGFDFTSLVAETLDGQLLAHVDESNSQGSLEVIIACVRFLKALLSINPERVWSILAKNSLIGLNDGTSALVEIVSGSEVPLGRFPLLSTFTELYYDLVHDATAGLVKRKAMEKQKANRFDSPAPLPDYTPERTISSVLSSSTAILTDASQNLRNWNFAALEEKAQIYSNIFKAFSKILRATYAVGVGSSKIGSPFTSAANVVMSCSAPANSELPLLASLTSLFSTSFAVCDDMLSLHQISLLSEQALCAVDLMRDSLDSIQNEQHAVSYATHILDFVPILAPAMTISPLVEKSIAKLLRNSLSAFGDDAPSSASIIRRLPSSSATSFLSTLVQLDSPLQDLSLECAIWDLLSKVMDSRLPWLAIFLLTGTLPKERLKHSGSDSHNRGKPLLAYALDQLSKLRDVTPERAIAMLKFVAHAQRAWVWATSQLLSHPEFVKNSLEWLEQIRPISPAANPAQSILSAREFCMAALLCEIFAVNLHAGLESGNDQLLQALVPYLGSLSEYAAEVNGYNLSLHRNLASNLKARFAGCEIDMFQRTRLGEEPYGRKFAYDLVMAETVLGHDQSWHGLDKSKSSGFAEEFARASINLSLVDAQTKLLQSWRTLAITLTECMSQRQELQSVLAVAARKCLEANYNANTEEPGTADRQCVRLDLAFVLISKLVSCRSTVAEVNALMLAAWNVVRSAPVSYDVVTAPEDLSYLRTLLQMLYMTIQPHTYPELKPSQEKSEAVPEAKYLNPELSSIFIELVSKIVCPSFKALCSNLHDSIDQAEPGDFALVSGILHATLSVRGISAIYSQISEAIANSHVIYSGLSLFSWSDQLAEVMDHDPVYGEITIMFLKSLSTIPTVATDMAVAGVLSQLSNANLSNYFRKVGGKGPFDEPQRVFVIWFEGFLPLCLNLLAAVGPPLAAEVAMFLNSFPQQLERAGTALQNRTPSGRDPNAGSITLSLLSEAHSLAMLSTILASDSARAAAEGVDGADIQPLSWDKATVKQDIEALTRNKRSLVDRIAPVGERENGWKNETATGSADNLLVAKVMKEVNEIRESGAFAA